MTWNLLEDTLVLNSQTHVPPVKQRNNFIKQISKRHYFFRQDLSRHTLRFVTYKWDYSTAILVIHQHDYLSNLRDRVMIVGIRSVRVSNDAKTMIFKLRESKISCVAMAYWTTAYHRFKCASVSDSNRSCMIWLFWIPQFAFHGGYLQAKTLTYT